MLVKGDKIKLVKKLASWLDNVGEICEVIDVDGDVISFRHGGGWGSIGIDVFDKYFVKYEEPTTITLEHIEQIINDSEISVQTLFDKCTVVACQLPNGFVIVESSACVDPKNYSRKMGYDICLKRIKDKIWELEGYKLQCNLYESQNNDDSEDNWLNGEV